MKQGRSLQALAAELQRQSETKKDFVAPQGAIEAVVVDNDVKIAGLPIGALAVDNHAHSQFAQHLSIPKPYYDRMRASQPALLAANLNTWLQAEGNEKRMVRTLDGRVRAVMSPKYRPLDNFELAHAVLPTLIERKAEIMSCELTETRMYIKAILPELSDALPVGMQWGAGHNNVTGDRAFGREGKIVAAIVIANSEVGSGTLRVEPSTFTTWCTNLAIMSQAAMKKYHVGRAFDVDADYSIYSDSTRKADDRAFWMKVKDVTNAAFDVSTFKAAIAQIREAAGQPIVSKELPRVVEVAVKRLALPVGSQGSILAHLAQGGDLTQWGLSSAITSTANDLDDYETATAFERAGGEVLTLDPRDWQAIAEAA